MLLTKGCKFVMIGDSITDCNRVRPVGEGKMDSLGDGYVSMVAALLNATYPDAHYRLVNMGVEGNTIRELSSRWQTDVLDLKPDFVSVMIGINDVWRHFNRPYQHEMHVSVQEYERTLAVLIEQTLPHIKGLVLATPYFIEPNRADSMRAMMDQYGGVIKKLATSYGATLVDTQSAFDSFSEHNYAATVSMDRVHVNRTGHIIIARAFLKALGYQWNS